MNKKYKIFRNFDEVLKYIKSDPYFKLKILHTNDTGYKVILTTKT